MGIATIQNAIGMETVSATIYITRKAYSARPQPIYYTTPTILPGEPTGYAATSGKVTLSLRISGRVDAASRDALIKLATQYMFVIIDIPDDSWLSETDKQFVITGLDIDEAPEHSTRPYVVTIELQKRWGELCSITS